MNINKYNNNTFSAYRHWNEIAENEQCNAGERFRVAMPMDFIQSKSLTIWGAYKPKPHLAKRENICL